MRPTSAGTLGKRIRFGILLTGLFAAVFLHAIPIYAQVRTSTVNTRSPSGGSAQEDQSDEKQRTASLDAFLGVTVIRIGFEGVDASRFTPLPERIAQMIGAPLTQENLSRSLRLVFGSGLFETVEVDGVREPGGIALIFKGVPRVFIGTVSVTGAKGATINTQLERASSLSPGTRFTEPRLNQALDRIREALADNGFHEPEITHSVTLHPTEQLMDIAFKVVSGPQARVGAVQVTGTPGMSVDEFRRHAHLRPGAHIDHDTANRALNGVLKYYQKEGRLEAEIKLESQSYAADTKKINFGFTVNRGPVVKLRLQGAGIGTDRLKHAIPVYEEGTVDEDLLNEGNRRLRDYFQRLGYFDVKVDHERQTPEPDQVVIVYTVTLGVKRRVENVSVTGKPILRFLHVEGLVERSSHRFAGSPWYLQPGACGVRRRRHRERLSEQRVPLGKGDPQDDTD